MNIIFQNNRTIIKNNPYFNLNRIFDCGQCFRFEKNVDGVWSGTAYGKQLSGYTEGDDTVLFCTEQEFNFLWAAFFDTSTDYAAVESSLVHDEPAYSAAQVSRGIRILKQDKWEALISFIISQNNNIPRIKKIISSLCELLGEKLVEGVYSFPSPERILACGAEGLAPIKAGFRVKYILDAASRVALGETDLDYIATLTYEQAEAELMKIKGVGKKVASCVLLFGYGFLSAFPIDVWVKRVLEKYYPADFDPISLGEYAGVAQQFLFYRERYLEAALK